jgi:hypothetical protein
VEEPQRSPAQHTRRLAYGGRRGYNAVMKPFSGNAPLAWIMAVGAVIAVCWPTWFGASVPLPGLRGLESPQVGWPFATASIALAVFLSIPRLLSRDRLLVCAGACLALCLVAMLYVSPMSGLLFGFVGGNILRENRAERSVS